MYHFNFKKITYFTLIVFLIQVVFQFITVFPVVQARYTQNDNSGFFLLEFMQNQFGIQTGSNITINTTAGTATINSGSLNASVTTVQILPPSFSAWQVVKLTATKPSNATITIDVLDCSGSIITGYNNLPYSSAGINISNLSPNTYQCIQIKTNLSRSSTSTISPSLSKVEVRWTPLPLFLIKSSVNSSSLACESTTFNVRFSVNYVDEQDVVVWTQLPMSSNTSGSRIYNYSGGYGQFPSLDPTFIDATYGGQYTSSPLTIQGQSIPANSVYRVMGDLIAGTTRNLSITLDVPCGTQNNTKYSLQPYIDGNLGSITTATPTVTTISSLPLPGLTTWLRGAYTTDYKNYILPDACGSKVVTYNIQNRNAPYPYANGNTTENIFSGYITEDLSVIFSGLQTTCGVSIPSTRIINISTGGVLSGSTIFRYESTQLFGSDGYAAADRSKITHSYQIDYAGCAISGFNFITTTTFDGNNIDPLIKTQKLNVGSIPSGGGVFSKTPDVPPGIYYEDTDQYTLNYSNLTTTGVDHLIVTDKISSDYTFVSASIPSGYTGYIYYSSTGGFNDPLNPPYFDSTNANFGNAGLNRSAVPISPVKWVAYYVHHLDPGFNTSICDTNTSLTGTTFVGNIKVKLDTPSGSYSFGTGTLPNSCKEYTYINTGNYQIVGGMTGSDQGSLRGLPIAPKLRFSVSSGSKDLQALQDGNYNFTVINEGKDTLFSGRVILYLPQINYDGVLTNLDINTVAGGIVDYLQSGKIIVNIGTLPVGASKTITFKTSIKRGVLEGDSYIINARAEGYDNPCGTVATTASISTKVHGGPELLINKTRDKSFIGQGNTILYTLTFSNQGYGVSTNSWIVDIVPKTVSFQRAYTNITSGGQTYSCLGCTVYFAPDLTSLPATLNPSDPIDPNLIATNFIIGTEVSPGQWTSPFGTATRYIAYKIDNRNFSPAIYRTNIVNKVGFFVKDVSTPLGGLIVNSAGILSNELIQALGNQVQTTLLGQPGLSVDIFSSKDILTACEAFDYIVDYTNDAVGSITTGALIISLPFGIELLTGTTGIITHNWNSLAIASGASAATGDISNSPYMTKTVNSSGETQLFFPYTQYRGALIGAGQGGRLTIKVKASCTDPSGMTPVATAVGTFANPIADGSVDDTDQVIIQNADLYIRKTTDNIEPLPGENVNYILTVSNEGQHDASGVVLMDTLPPGLCYVTNSTTVLTPNRVLGQPIVIGTCTIGQTLLRNISNNNAIRTTIINPLTTSTYATGTIPGQSDDIRITYRALVQSNTIDGTTLSNGATISTSTTEDTVYTNSSSHTIQVPYPDPYTTIIATSSTLPGDNIDITINYANNSRTCTKSGVVLYTVPDYDGDNISDIVIDSIIANDNEGIYYHTCPTTSLTPFDYTTSPSGFRSSTRPSQDSPSAMICQIAIKTSHDLCFDNGIQRVVIAAQAKDELTNLVPGTTLTHQIVITGSNGDTNLLNNISSAITRIPSVDLSLDIVGSTEGNYPGLTPGDSLRYTVNFSNLGNVLACQDYVDIAFDSTLLDPQILPLIPTTLLLTDRQGNILTPLDSSGNTLTSPVTLIYTPLAPGIVRVGFGSSNGSTSICLPGTSQGTFDLLMKVKTTAPDSSQIIATGTIVKLSAGAEDTLTNNTDMTNTIVYRPDLTIRKTAVVDQDANGVFTTGVNDSTISALQSRTIRYKLEYDNIGNATAKSSYVTEKMPAGTCLKVAGSPLAGVFTNLAPGTIVEYSNDNGASRGYSLVNVNSMDCAVTHVRWKLGDVPAPANYYTEQDRGQRQSSGMVDLVPTTKGRVPQWTDNNIFFKAYGQEGYDALLKGIGSRSNRGGSNNMPIMNPTYGIQSYGLSLSPFPVNKNQIDLGFTLSDGGDIGDFNNDGRLDFITVGFTNTLFLNTSTGTTTSFVRTDILTGGWKNGGMAADFNRDGKVDMIAFSNPSKLFLNTTTGSTVSFSVSTPSFSIFNQGSSLAGDINNDGKIDIIAPNNTVAYNTITGYSGLPSFVQVNIPGSIAAFNPSIGDFNNDGKLDTFLNSYGGVGHQYGINATTGAIPILNLVSSIVGLGGSVSMAGNFNGDNLIDIIGLGGYEGIYTNISSGSNISFLFNRFPFTTNVNAGISADFNGDGKLDAFELSTTSVSDTKLYTNVINGIVPSFAQSFYLGKSFFSAGATADFNNDGKLDVVGLGNNGSTILFMNTYPLTGRYSTIVSGTSTLQSWNKLIIDQTLQAGTNLKYTIYSVSSTGTCLTGSTPLIGQIERPTDGYINLGSIDASNKRICVVVDFFADSALTTNKTPILNGLTTTWTTTERPYFTFDVLTRSQIRQSTSGNYQGEYIGDELIPNTATISTISLEITGSNNSSSYDLNFFPADLAVTKRVSQAAVTAGTTISYTLSYINNGPQSAQSVFIDDLLPDGFTFLSSSVAGANLTSGAIVIGKRFTLGTLSIGQTGTIVITGTISGSVSVGDILTNNATIYSVTNYDPDLSNNSSSPSSVVGSYANLWAAIDTPPMTNLNNLLSGTVVRGNNGNGPAFNSVLTIALDTGVTFVSTNCQLAVPACSYSGAIHSIIWPLGTVMSGSGGTITFLTQVNNDLTLLLSGNTILDFTSAFTTSSDETDTADNISTDSTRVVPGLPSSIAGVVYADLDISQSRTTGDQTVAGAHVYLYGQDIYGMIYGPDPVIDSGAYHTFIASNTTRSTILTTNSSLYQIVSPIATSNNGQYSFGSLLPGTYNTALTAPVGYSGYTSTGGILRIQSGTSFVSTTIPTGTGSLNGGSSITDITTIVLGENQQSRANDYGLKSSSINLIVNSITALTGPAGLIRLDINYGNTTVSDASGVELSIGLPSGVSPSSVQSLLSSSQGLTSYTYNSSTNTITFSITSLSGYTNHTLSLLVNNTNPIASTGLILGFVSTIASLIQTEITELDNTKSTIFTLRSVTNGLSGVVFFDNNRLTGYQSGSGDYMMSGVRVYIIGQDIYGNVYVPLSGAASRSGIAIPSLSGNGVYYTGLMTLTSSGTSGIAIGGFLFTGLNQGTYTVIIDNSMFADLKNFTSSGGILSGTTSARGSGLLQNNSIKPFIISGIVLTTGQFVKDLQFGLIKNLVDLTTIINPIVSTGVVAGYDIVPYTIIYGNSGYDTETNPIITVALPSGTYLTSLQTGAYYTTGTHSISFPGGILSGGMTGLLQFTLGVLTGVTSGSILPIAVNITGVMTDINLANNPSIATIMTVAPSANINLNKSADLNIVIVQLDTLQYQLVVCNSGPHLASGVIITDILPSTLQYQSSSRPYNSTYITGGSTAYVYNILGMLTVNACTGVTMTVAISGGVMSGTTLTNQATVTSAIRDPDSSDNSDTVTSTGITVHTLHNFIYFDINFNGIRDTGEPLLPVNLILSGMKAGTGGNGIYPINTNQLFLNPGGDAQVPNLLDGTYTISFDTSDPDLINAGFGLSEFIITTTGDNNGHLTGNIIEITGGTYTGLMVGVHLANDLQTVISTSTPTAIIGETITYDITYFNTLAGGDPNATLTFTIPTGSDLINTTFPGILSGNIFTYNIGPISGYDYGFGTVTLLITSLINSGSIFALPTTITGSGLDLYPFNNTSVISTPAIDPQAQVSITKKADLSIAIVQLDNIDYELVVCNSGPQSASGVKVMDIMPPTLQYQSSSVPYDSSYNSGLFMIYEYSFTGLLAINTCRTLIINATMSGNVMSGMLVINQAVVTGATLDPDSSDNNDIATTLAHTVHTVVNYVFYDTNYNGILDNGEIFLPIDLIISGNTAIVSGNGSYPISTRTLPLIGGLSLFDNALDGTYDYLMNQSDIDYLNLTGPIIVTTLTGISGTTGGSIVITGGTQTGVVIGLYQPVDLYTSITADHITPVAGYEFVSFTVSYGNSGYGYEPNAFVTIEIPNTLLYHIGDLPVYSISSSGSSNLYTFALSGLVSGSGGLFGFTGFVLTGTATGTLTPIVSTITGGALDVWLDNNQNQVDLTIQSPTASLSVTKTGDVSIAIVQLDQINYSIYACNAGPHSASGVVIKDTVPYNLTVMSMNATPDSYSAAVSGVEYIFNYPGMLDAGQCTPPIIMTVEFTPGQTDNNELVDNIVTVSSDVYDDNLSNNTASKSVTGLLLRDIPSYIFRDENNNGVYDNIDQYLSIDMFIDGLLAITGADGSYPTLTRGQDQLMGGFSIATGLMYGTYTMWIDQTDPDYINFGPYTITTAMNPNGNFSGAITVDDATYTGLYIGLYKPRIDLNVWIDVSTGTAKSGDNLTYTITYSNSGIDTASGVVISIPRPTELSLDSISFPYVLSGGSLLFFIDSVDTLSTGTIIIDTTALSTVIPGQSIIPIATIAGQGFEMDYTYNQSFTSTIIRNRESDLSLVKEADKTQIYPNDTITYLFHYVNNGSDDAGDVYISDMLPSSTVLLSSTVPYTFTGVTGGILYYFSLGTVPAGMSGTVTATVRYDDSFVNTLIVNTGTIYGLPYIIDYDLSNNISSTSGVTMLPLLVSQGGFAGGGGIPRDTCPLGDYTASYYDGQCSISSGTITTIQNNSGIILPHSPSSGVVPIIKKPQLKLLSIPYETHEVTNTIVNPLKSAVGSLNFSLPSILPQTGTPLQQLRDRGVSVVKNKQVQTEMYDWIVPVSPRIYKKRTDLNYWLNRLPENKGYQYDKHASTYLVIPRLGIIAPIVDIPQSEKDYKKILYGQSIDVNYRLQGGVLHYPLTALPASIGNMIIVGHSSYFENDSGRYKTIFTSLPLLTLDDEIWIYQKSNITGDVYDSIQDRSGSGYNRYVYMVTRSFETDKKDVNILEPQIGSTLTLMTCTPIGTAKNRRVVQSKILAPDHIDVTKKVKIYKITSEFIAIVKGRKTSIDKLPTDDQKLQEKKKIKSIISKKWGNKTQRQEYTKYTIQELSL